MWCLRDTHVHYRKGTCYIRVAITSQFTALQAGFVCIDIYGNARVGYSPRAATESCYHRRHVWPVLPQIPAMILNPYVKYYICGVHVVCKTVPNMLYMYGLPTCRILGVAPFLVVVSFSDNTATKHMLLVVAV